MDLVKKNIVGIVCGVIALLAVVASFWPLGGMFTTLATTAEERKGSYDTLQGLLNKPRKLPLTDPSSTVQDDLKQFPNQKTIDLGNEVTKKVSDESKLMLDKAVQLNVHQPLIDDALPDPQTDAPKFRFNQTYQQVLATDPKAGKASDPKSPPNLRNDILQAGVPPTTEEITAAKNDLWKNTYEPRIIYVNQQPVNQNDVQADFNIAAARLPVDMKTDVAKKKKIYASSDAFTISANVTGRDTPDVRDIWWAQVGLWVQQDVATALADINRSSTSIIDAPVKHLIKLTVPLQFVPNPSTPAPQPGVPVAPLDPNAPVPKVTTVSATGRVSNGLYDVVSFTLIINVDASKVTQVINAIGQNRLITVNKVDMATIDSATEQDRGFIYGPVPIIQLTLQCEELFMRDWTSKLMPKSIRAMLGVPDAPPPTATPAATPTASAQ